MFDDTGRMLLQDHLHPCGFGGRSIDLNLQIVRCGDDIGDKGVGVDVGPVEDLVGIAGVGFLDICRRDINKMPNIAPNMTPIKNTAIVIISITPTFAA